MPPTVHAQQNFFIAYTSLVRFQSKVRRTARHSQRVAVRARANEIALAAFESLRARRPAPAAQRCCGSQEAAASRARPSVCAARRFAVGSQDLDITDVAP